MADEADFEVDFAAGFAAAAGLGSAEGLAGALGAATFAPRLLILTSLSLSESDSFNGGKSNETSRLAAGRAA
jgi:hypothetical protein